MKPGAIINPRASNVSPAPPRIWLGRAISATRPSLSNTSMGSSIFAAGSIKWPPVMRREPDLDLSFGMLTLVEPEGLKPQALRIAYGSAEALPHPKSPQPDCLVHL